MERGPVVVGTLSGDVNNARAAGAEKSWEWLQIAGRRLTRACISHISVYSVSCPLKHIGSIEASISYWCWNAIMPSLLGKYSRLSKPSKVVIIHLILCYQLSFSGSQFEVSDTDNQNLEGFVIESDKVLNHLSMSSNIWCFLLLPRRSLQDQLHIWGSRYDALCKSAGRAGKLNPCKNIRAESETITSERWSSGEQQPKSVTACGRRSEKWPHYFSSSLRFCSLASSDQRIFLSDIKQY